MGCLDSLIMDSKTCLKLMSLSLILLVNACLNMPQLKFLEIKVRSDWFSLRAFTIWSTINMIWSSKDISWSFDNGAIRFLQQ